MFTPIASEASPRGEPGLADEHVVDGRDAETAQLLGHRRR